MIVTKLLNYNASRYATNDKSDIIEIDKDLTRVYTCLQGNVRFGPGTSGNDGENLYGQWLTLTTNGTPDTEDTFNHTCGVIPVGFLVVWQDKAGSLYQSPTSGTDWTISTISLKCNVASVTFKIFLLK